MRFTNTVTYVFLQWDVLKTSTYMSIIIIIIIIIITYSEGLGQMLPSLFDAS